MNDLIQILYNIFKYLSVSNSYLKLLLLVPIAIISYYLSRWIFGWLRKLIITKIEISAHLIDLKFRNASAILLTIIILNIILPAFKIDDPIGYYIRKSFFIGFVFSLAYMATQITEFIKDYVYLNKAIDIQNNLSNRKIRTQIDFIQKVSTVFIMTIAVSIILMSFARVREIGTSIIASAGIAGVIIGFAAQKSLANLLAGMQIAFTQPIRIDDVVVVENEWGRIEEVTLTYVVVKIWDQRRLILPISYFIEKPFQNWTRSTSEIIGNIILYVDYSVPVAMLRSKMMEILGSTPLWNGKVAALQVTDLTEKAVQLRGIMGSANASDSWDLRCLVREKLIDYIKENYPSALPKLRTEIVKESENLL